MQALVDQLAALAEGLADLGVVVFSVPGRREVAGRSGTILEGESGANDPVCIALMASLLTAGQTAGLDAASAVVGGFLLQLVVGAAVGVAGVGYRVSTTDQQPHLQVDALERAGCYQVVTETASGARSDIPTLEQLLDQLRPGDTLAV